MNIDVNGQIVLNTLHAKGAKALPALSKLGRFEPTGRRADGWSAAIYASQHPAVCERYLLVEDDLIGTGFGIDAKYFSATLLMAVYQQRVLLHVPAIGAHPYKYFPNTTAGRWCDRPPFTLDCMWEPLSHCDPPPPGTVVASPTIP